jgi:hypothetical protein
MRLKSRALRLKRRSPRYLARIFQEPGISQCLHKEFIAFAFESFLGGFEVCDAGCDFFPLQSGVIRRFGHAHPFLIRVPLLFVGAIGARIGSERRSIVIARACSKFAVDKIHRGGKQRRRPCALRFFPVAKRKTGGMAWQRLIWIR